MRTVPHVINSRSKSDAWLFEPDAAEGTEALRESCRAGVLEDELFYHYGELPQRMQKAFMDALRGVDTEANDREVGRIMRAAFKRAVEEALDMRVSRIKAESMINFREEN